MLAGVFSPARMVVSPTTTSATSFVVAENCCFSRVAVRDSKASTRPRKIANSAALFPSPRQAGYLSRQGLAKELKEVCEALELRGVGTHSFRRSLATSLHAKGIPIKTIASITGHESLNELSRYLEVTPQQRRAAILTLR